MKHLQAVLLLVMLLAIGCGVEKQSGLELSSMELTSADGSTVSLKEIEKSEASVFLFLQPECPFCHSYGRTFRNTDSVLRASGIPLYGVMAGENFTVAQLKEYSERYHLKFPVLLDPDFRLTRTLGATITPQVFFVDRKGTTLYHGMIDNWGYEIGKTRARATEFYLVDALMAFLDGKPQPLDSTKAVGCYIQ